MHSIKCTALTDSSDSNCSMRYETVCALTTRTAQALYANLKHFAYAPLIQISGTTL